MKRLLYFLPLGLLAGCVHTHVVREEVTPVDAVYKQILVCSLSNDAERAELIETVVNDLLKKHHVKTATCHDFLNTQTAPDRQKQDIQEAGYQAVLVFQRESSEEKTGPIPVAAVLQKEDVPEKSSESMESSTQTDTLDGFLNAYASRMSANEAEVEKASEVTEDTLTGKRRSITGVIKLIDTNQNQVSWLGGGTVEGPASEPFKSLMKAVAERAINELSNAGLIPSR